MKSKKYLVLLLALFFGISGQELVQLANPNQNQGQIKGIAVAPDGTAYFGGVAPVSNTPAMYQYNGSQLSQITNPNGDTGQITAVGVDLNGTAYFVGQDMSASNRGPLIYKYTKGEISRIFGPATANRGSIDALAIDPYMGNVYLGGFESATSMPIAWIINNLASGATLTPLVNPNTHLGSISTVVVASNEVVFFGGVDGTLMRSLVWRYDPLTKSLVKLDNPSDDRIPLITSAAGPDGVVYFAGIDQTTMIPAVYRYNPTTSALSLLPNPNSDEGIIYSVAVGPNGIPYFGGENTSTTTPFVWIFNGTSLQALTSPNTDPGVIFSVEGMGDGAVYFGGIYANSSTPLIWTAVDGVLAEVQNPNTGEGEIFAIGTGGIASDGANGAVYFGGNNSSLQPLIYETTGE